MIVLPFSCKLMQCLLLGVGRSARPSFQNTWILFLVCLHMYLAGKEIGYDNKRRLHSTRDSSEHTQWEPVLIHGFTTHAFARVWARLNLSGLWSRCVLFRGHWSASKQAVVYYVDAAFFLWQREHPPHKRHYGSYQKRRVSTVVTSSSVLPSTPAVHAPLSFFSFLVTKGIGSNSGRPDGAFPRLINSHPSTSLNGRGDTKDPPAKEPADYYRQPTWPES